MNGQDLCLFSEQMHPPAAIKGKCLVIAWILPAYCPTDTMVCNLVKDHITKHNLMVRLARL